MLPAGVSRDGREGWHGLCARHGLWSESRGVGENRRLVIGTSRFRKLRQHDESWRLTPVNPEAVKLASQLWSMLADDCGGEARYSQAELEEIVTSHAELPPDLQRLVDIGCDVFALMISLIASAFKIKSSVFLDTLIRKRSL